MLPCFSTMNTAYTGDSATFIVDQTHPALLVASHTAKNIVQSDVVEKPKKQTRVAWHRGSKCASELICPGSVPGVRENFLSCWGLSLVQLVRK